MNMEVEVKIQKTNGETEVVKYGPQKKYDQSNTVQLKLKLNKKTDADILEWMETLDNKQGMIKKILRQYINQERQEE